MKQRLPRLALARLLTITAALAVLVSGVTFAALQSQNVTLQGSRITSATASLAIGNTAASYGMTMTGFDFSNVEPGGQPMPSPGYSMFLRNNGTSKLAVKLAMNPNTFANPQSATADRIYINITPVDGDNAGQMRQFTLASLLAGYGGVPADMNLTIPAGQAVQLALQVQMAGDAVSSTLSGVTLSGIDLIFSGNSVTT